MEPHSAHSSKTGWQQRLLGTRSTHRCEILSCSPSGEGQAMAAFQGHDTTGDEPFAPGDQVYAEDGDGWRLATVQSTAGNSITLDDGSECAIDELLRCNDADADDVSTLQQIHEPAVLKCLEGRDYAFCGPNVIIARGHAHRKMAGFASNPHPEPHVYALVERAFEPALLAKI